MNALGWDVKTVNEKLPHGLNVIDGSSKIADFNVMIDPNQVGKDSVRVEGGVAVNQVRIDKGLESPSHLDVLFAPWKRRIRETASLEEVVSRENVCSING